MKVSKDLFIKLNILIKINKRNQLPSHTENERKDLLSIATKRIKQINFFYFVICIHLVSF